jgi:hypothetical protein
MNSLRTPVLFAAIMLLCPSAAAAQDYAPGEKLTMFNCGRCHKVSEKDRMGGIGSTPSFAALRSIADWEARMKAFWTLRPHPTFTQVEGMTEPFPPERPPNVHPVSLTLKEIDIIVEFARTIEPLDLGPDLGLN